MEFWILTVLAVISFIYCCDFPALFNLNLLINRKDSIWFAMGCSIIAAYIFYCIQVVLPQKINERKAFEILSKRIDSLLDEVYHLLMFCECICQIDREKIKIDVPCVYALRSKKGEENFWIEKIIIQTLVNRINIEKSKLVTDGYFMQINDKKRRTLRKLIDNRFPDNFIDNYNYPDIQSMDIIQSYDEFCECIKNARSMLKQTEEYVLIPYTDERKIIEFENKLESCDFYDKHPDACPYMKI